MTAPRLKAFPVAVKIVLGLVVAVFVAFTLLTMLGIFDRAWWMNNAAAIAGHVLTLAGIIVGAVMILHQISRGYEASINLQREAKRNELQLMIYQSLSDQAGRVLGAQIELTSYLRRGSWSIDSYLRSVARSGSNPLMEINQSAAKLIDLHGVASNGVSALIQETEKWEVSIPRLEIFRFALSSALHDVSEEFHRLAPIAVQLLPDEDIEDRIKPVFYAAVTPGLYAEYEGCRLNLEDFSSDLVSYAMDLRVEAQNSLVSVLFDGRKAIRRQPEDPQKIVITTDAADYERLYRHFTFESAQGKSNQEAIAEVRKMVAERDGRKT